MSRRNRWLSSGGKREKWYEAHTVIWVMIFLLGTLSGTLALTAAVEWSREVGIEDAIYEVREFDGYDVHYGSQKEGISSIELIFVGGESREIKT